MKCSCLQSTSVPLGSSGDRDTSARLSAVCHTRIVTSVQHLKKSVLISRKVDHGHFLPLWGEMGDICHLKSHKIGGKHTRIFATEGKLLQTLLLGAACPLTRKQAPYPAREGNLQAGGGSSAPRPCAVTSMALG